MNNNLIDDKNNIQNQVMWNRLLSVVEEQGQTLVRTAFSPIVRECGDISAGVFDLEGRMMAQAVTGTPGHVNSMAESVKHFINYFPLNTMNEGDIFITNDPWMGTGHLNDFVLTTPCFKDNKIVGLFSCTSHLTDIGGLGVGPDATDIHMEGLYIPMLKLSDKGLMNKTLLKLVSQNTRQPVETEGDVYSLAACNDIGCTRLVEMMKEFEIDDLSKIQDFDQWLKLNNLILRHMTVSLDQKPEKHIEKSTANESKENEDAESQSKNNGIESDVEESPDSENIQKDKEFNTWHNKQ